MNKRGRPAEITEENRIKQWEHTAKFDDGTVILYKFDLDKNPNGGMISSEVIKEAGLISVESDSEPIHQVGKFLPPPDNDKLPKSKRKYYNPGTGKWVAYFRAKELGIVD